MKSIFLTLFLSGGLFALSSPALTAQKQMPQQEKQELSLITKTPEEGYQLAIKLARKGVTEIQTDREVLFALREVYSRNPESLIAASHVIAVHFQTIAAANNYWRDKE